MGFPWTRGGVMCGMILAVFLVAAPAGGQDGPGKQPDAVQWLADQSRHAVSWEELRTQLDDLGVHVTLSDERGGQRGAMVISLSMQMTTPTSEGRGLLGRKWDRRHVANINLLEIGTDLYLVLSAEGSTSLKAPWGAWHVEEEAIPDFYTGPGVGGMVRGRVSVGP